MLKAQGDYSARNYITDNQEECTRYVNFANVSMIRTFEKRDILVDGHINITFRTPEERNDFLHRYREYIHPKTEKKKNWWEF